MKRQIITILILAYSNISVSQTVPPDYIKKKFDGFLNSVDSIRLDTKEKVDELKGSLGLTQNPTIGRLKKAEEKIALLTNDIIIIKRIDSVEITSRKDILRKRYALATQSILPGMIRGVVYVKKLSQFVSIEQKVNSTTNPWSDKDLRDGFDRLKDFTPLFAIAGAGAPLLNDKSNPKTAIVSGLIGMLIPQAISWIGKSGSKAN